MALNCGFHLTTYVSIKYCEYPDHTLIQFSFDKVVAVRCLISTSYRYLNT